MLQIIRKLISITIFHYLATYLEIGHIASCLMIWIIDTLVIS